MIDALLAEARGQAPAPDDALMARVLADATAVQDARHTRPAPVPPGLWARAMEAIGGWPALGSLTAATVAGLWVGIAPPAAVSDVTAALTGEGMQVSLFASDGFDIAGIDEDG